MSRAEGQSIAAVRGGGRRRGDALLGRALVLLAPGACLVSVTLWGFSILLFCLSLFLGCRSCGLAKSS
jgi:hypothetical protein